LLEFQLNCNLICAFDKLNEGFTENDDAVISYILFWPGLDFRKWQMWGWGCLQGTNNRIHRYFLPKTYLPFLTLPRSRRPYLTCLAKLSHHRTPAFHRFSPFWWYRFQNSSTVWDNGLKFGMVMMLGKLEDHVLCFLPGRVHK
jgi:hypothetical protein